MKIITVTLNPCIDINYKTDGVFSAGVLNRVPLPHITYSGKGINVSRCLYIMGEDSVAMTVCDKNGELEEKLRAEGLCVTAIRGNGGLRHNISILDKNGAQTQINEPGMELSPDIIKEFIGMFKSELNCGDKVVAVISGSVPPGVEKSVYKKLCTIAKNSGAYVVVDCDGEALRSAVEATPDLISPNLDEFAALTGKLPEGSGEALRINAVRAALEFSRNEGCAVLCTLGEDGSVFAGPEGSYMCQAAKADIKTFKGAGDCFLASFILEHMVRDKDCDMALMLASTATARYLSR